MDANHFRAMFNRTILPSFQTTTEYGELVIMDYNLFINKHKLNPKYIEIVDHCTCKSSSRWLCGWMFMVRDVENKVQGINGLKLKRIDPIRLIHYVNKMKLTEQYEVFDWAKSNEFYDIPLVHHEVAEMVELSVEADRLEKKIKNELY